MTLRDKLDRQARWIFFPMYGGMLIFIAGIIANAALGQQWTAVVALPGFALAFAATMFGYLWGFRCPCCRCSLAPLVFHPPGFGVDRRVHFCPYCGRGLDEEIQ